MNPEFKNLIFKILLIILLLNTLLLNAQTNDNAETENYKNNSFVSVSLLSHLNTQTPRWSVGYIKNINDKWKIGFDFGYGNKNISIYNSKDNLGKEYKLWEIRPELYYLINSKKKSVQYFSTELFYIDHKDTFIDYHYFPQNGESMSYDKANFHRQKYGFNIKYGFFLFSKKRLAFNFFTGLGLRVRNNTYSEIINSQITDLGPEGGDMFGFTTYKTVEGTNFGVNFSLGVKLLVRLNN